MYMHVENSTQSRLNGGDREKDMAFLSRHIRRFRDESKFNNDRQFRLEAREVALASLAALITIATGIAAVNH